MRIKSFCFVFRAVQSVLATVLCVRAHSSAALHARAPGSVLTCVRARSEGGLGNCHRSSAITEQ